MRHASRMTNFGLVASDAVGPKAYVEILQETHGQRCEHVEAGAAVVHEVVAALPVNLLHNVLSPVIEFLFSMHLEPHRFTEIRWGSSLWAPRHDQRRGQAVQRRIFACQYIESFGLNVFNGRKESYQAT